jgi:hypothetical protein
LLALYSVIVILSLRIVPAFKTPVAFRDFTNLWMAGKLVLDGQVTAIFDIDAFQRATQAILGVSFGNNYSYPPHALFLAIPFALLPLPAALLAWNVFGLILFYLAAKPLIPKGLPTWVVLLSPASLMCLYFGHYGLVCGALWMWAFRGSGFSAAALTIKPHLGLLVAVQMLRERRALLTAMATTAFLVLASSLAFGADTWRAFLTGTFQYQVGLLEGSRANIGINMVTPYISYGFVGQIAFAASAIFLLTRRFDVFTAATATFLILPYGFHYDLTVVCAGFAILLASRWGSMAPWQKLVACAAYLTPTLVVYGSWIVPPILLAGLYLQTILAPASDPDPGSSSAVPAN